VADLCNIDGVISEPSAARVSVMDRGFLFGDSVYEVLRTHHAKLLCLDRHLARLHTSADRIELRLPLTDAVIEERVRATLAAAGNAESYIRIIITRGVASRPDLDPDFTLGAPTMVILVRDLRRTEPDAVPKALSAWLVTTRRNDRRALDPAIKSGNYLNNILGLMEAKKRGADVALFLNTDGQLTEAPTANLWLVRGGRILTPGLDAGILAGVTRAMLLEIGQRGDLPMAEASLYEADLRTAGEVFLSSTLRDVVPIVRLDGRPIGNGEPGPVTLDLRRRYLAHCDELVR
jgi:branched-chain amino acid aminotransferase